MINTIRFKNFKALEDFTIHLKDFNVLTGPNNNGKSTILDGLRVLQGAFRYASRYNPRLIKSLYGGTYYGYEIPAASIPIILENVQTNFNTDEPSILTFKLEQGKTLTLYFHNEHPTYLFFDTPNRTPLSATSFRKEFPLNISIVPTLGPFEVEEELLDADYVKRWYGSRRSPRMFRSYWFYNSEHFSEFKEQVEKTWKGMSISLPERRSTFSKEIVMFCEEERMPREICWAGFGFQIWLQLLTHIINSKNANIIIVDEPEVYLHPDLQHKILDLLKTKDAKVILATHSVEIINSIEPSEVLLIDKRNKSSKRISDLEGLQSISNILGSGQNIQLTRLARGKKILFVEGLDAKLLNRAAKICKLDDLFTSGEITTIAIEGFTQHERIIHTNWAFSKVLGESLKIAVLLDRDYRTDEEIAIVEEKLTSEVSLIHILQRKEIENYFIIPGAIEKAVFARLPEGMDRMDVENLIYEVTSDLKEDTKTQLIAHKAKFNQKSAKDISTIIKEASIQFEKEWKDSLFRFSKIGGKTFFTLLNQRLQDRYKINITITQVASHMKQEDICVDLRTFLKDLDDVKNSR
jgi:energy-coupling factor transporter ATP-binding protein EcfA2